MKSRVLFAIVLLALTLKGHALSLEEISPHFSSAAQILWKAPTNALPKTLWTYQRRPQIFSAVTVSNAAALGEFKPGSFPKSFAKPFTVWAEHLEGDPQPDYFSVEPNLGLVSFRRQRRLVAKGETGPVALINRTWQYAAQLGLDKTQFVQGIVIDSTVSLSRVLDGIAFQEDIEGFSVQYGAQGEIRSLGLTWPKLERVSQERVIGPDEIMRCIRAFKTPVLPGNDETNFFARVRALSTAKALTIFKLTPYYGEGKYGEQPNDGEPEKFVEPVLALDAVADWGNSNAPVRLFAPLIASDADRLLAQKTKKP